MDEKILFSTNELIKNIYTLRSVQVMLDLDLAKLYGVKAIRLREQVKRNLERFPIKFMFQLSLEEIENLRSQFATTNDKVSQNAIPSKQQLGGSLPYAFTEQGIAMLSAVLRTETAIKISIFIMDAFVEMRRSISPNNQIFYRLENLENKYFEHDKKIGEVFDAIESEKIKPNKGILFENQMFDAHLLIIDIIKSASKSIVLIDNYIDESVLTLFNKRKNGVSVTIYTNIVSPELKLALKKYNSQHAKVEVEEFKLSHDRFIIIDEKEVYHFGASLKDLGKKWFAFSKFENESLELLNKLKKGDS